MTTTVEPESPLSSQGKPESDSTAPPSDATSSSETSPPGVPQEIPMTTDVKNQAAPLRGGTNGPTIQEQLAEAVPDRLPPEPRRNASEKSYPGPRNVARELRDAEHWEHLDPDTQRQANKAWVILHKPRIRERASEATFQAGDNTLTYDDLSAAFLVEVAHDYPELFRPLVQSIEAEEIRLLGCPDGELIREIQKLMQPFRNPRNGPEKLADAIYKGDLSKADELLQIKRDHEWKDYTHAEVENLRNQLREYNRQQAEQEHARVAQRTEASDRRRAALREASTSARTNSTLPSPAAVAATPVPPTAPVPMSTSSASVPEQSAVPTAAPAAAAVAAVSPPPTPESPTPSAREAELQERLTRVESQLASLQMNPTSAPVPRQPRAVTRLLKATAHPFVAAADFVAAPPSRWSALAVVMLPVLLTMPVSVVLWEVGKYWLAQKRAENTDFVNGVSEPAPSNGMSVSTALPPSADPKTLPSPKPSSLSEEADQLLQRLQRWAGSTPRQLE